MNTWYITNKSRKIIQDTTGSYVSNTSIPSICWFHLTCILASYFIKVLSGIRFLLKAQVDYNIPLLYMFTISNYPKSANHLSSLVIISPQFCLFKEEPISISYTWDCLCNESTFFYKCTWMDILNCVIFRNEIIPIIMTGCRGKGEVDGLIWIHSS